MLDHFLHTAHAGARLLYPQRDAVTPPPPSAGTSPEELADREQALTWFTAEHHVLLACVDGAVRAGYDTHVWQLAWTMATYLHRYGHWQHWADTQCAALAAGTRLRDRAAQAQAHRRLARAYIQLGRLPDADRHLARAIPLFDVLGDRPGQAYSHLGLTMVYGHQDNHAAALGHARQALDLFLSVDHRAGQASALNTVGWHQAQLGEHAEALVHCQRALTLDQEIGNRYGEADTWDSLGYIHRHLAHPDRAVECYRQALALRREFGDRYEEAVTLIRIGDTYRDAGGPESARDAWRGAGRSSTSSAIRIPRRSRSGCAPGAPADRVPVHIGRPEGG